MICFTSEADKDLQQLKSENVKKTYVRDSEVTWLTDDWIYDIVIPFVENVM